MAQLGLGDAVVFEGHASDATVAAAFASADVLIVASEHEGFCVPVVEAMAAGLPVVAYDQGAVPEVLGDAGMLVAIPMLNANAKNDPVAMRNALIELLLVKNQKITKARNNDTS